MDFEKLALEVGAMKAGLEAVSPHVLQGGSGIRHRFDLLFADGSRYYGFDFYDHVSEVEVVKSYAKKFDAGAVVSLVSPADGVTEEARRLAYSYGIRIITPDEAGSFFAQERVPPRRVFG